MLSKVNVVVQKLLNIKEMVTIMVNGNNKLKNVLKHAKMKKALKASSYIQEQEDAGVKNNIVQNALDIEMVIKDMITQMLH